MSTAIAERFGMANELLTLALSEVRGWVEDIMLCASNTSDDPDKYGPVPGTLESDCIEEIERQLDLIRKIESHLGEPPFYGPAWLDDLIALRGDWKGGVQ